MRGIIIFSNYNFTDFKDGAFFCDLWITGKVRRTAISLRNLLHVIKHLNANNYKYTETSDIIGDYNESLTKSAPKNRSDATKKVSLEYDARKLTPESTILPENKPKVSKSLNFNQDKKSLLPEEELEKFWNNFKIGDKK